MHITMIKKRLLNGDPCAKCAQTEEMLRRRDLWQRIDEVVWAIEGDGDSPGAVLSRQHGVERAPFFIVRGEGGTHTVFLSALQLIREHLSGPSPAPASNAARATIDAGQEELIALADKLRDSHPAEILKWALERYSERCALRFEGSEDIVLIDMATQLGLPISIFAIDTGRLRPEGYRYLDTVRDHYGVVIDVHFPDAAAVADLVRRKGPNSFLRDGHAECCSIRRVAPLSRALGKFDAWVSGRRNHQRPPTDSRLAVVAQDAEFAGEKGTLVRVNPLANWTREQLWSYIEERQLPVNELHAQGFVAIGCEPCTRRTQPDQPERDGLWWWESPEPEPEPEPELAGEGI